MLDKIPLEFWTSIKKVFEPCAGKGGFIVDIIDRFMNGLEKTIPVEKERYDRSEKYVKRPSTRKRKPKKYLD